MHLKFILTPILGLLLSCSTIAQPAFSQTDDDTFASIPTTPSTVQSQEEDSDEDAGYTELSPAHSTAYVLSPNSRTLQLLHSLPKFTSQAIVYIMDLTGRILKRITLDPKDKGGSKIYLNDLLSGNYQYLLVLDSGRKIQGEFELTD
ncbi:MAG TPA: T9SS type A sorting domain-containing protein [Catalimonadaceae bacterium]|nr:T9SS type A sorting domain-containing protein [Catalimonadaceae bacterium]HPI10944.1 T9SS type A sorting domain-containing protein [Catalimonadaceae bacterium]